MASNTPTPPRRPAQAQAWLRALLDASALEPFCEIVHVTPDVARALLTLNHDNRNLSKNQVTQIASDIRNGRWQFNGESVVMSKTGELNDGQHRLHAIVEAGIGVPLVVVGGATRESRMTLDMGRVRNIHDYLNLMGVKNPNVVASAARLVLAFEASGGKTFDRIKWISRAEGINRGLTDTALHVSGAWAQANAKDAQFMIPPSPLAVCHYLIGRAAGDQGREYMEKLIEGANLPRGSAILKVRRYLPTFSSRGGREAKIALVIRGWNFWARGDEPTIEEMHGRLPLPKLVTSPK